MRLLGGGQLPLRTLARQILAELREDLVWDTAAQLAYYFLLAVFPLLFFITALAAYLPLEPALNALLQLLRPVLPRDALALVEDRLRGLLGDQRPSLLSVALFASLWPASRGADAFRRALNAAYRIRESRPYWKTQLLALGVTVAGALLLLAVVGLLLAGSAAGWWAAEQLGVKREYVLLAKGLRWPVSAALITTVAALAYRLLPDVKQRFKFIAAGAVLGTLVWLAVTWVFGQYADRFQSYSRTYGSLGGVLVMLTWFYLSGFIFVFAGRLNAIVEHASLAGKAPGTRQGRSNPGRSILPTSTVR